MDKSACGVIVVVAVLVLFPGVGSVTPDGGVTLAIFVIVPLAPAVPVILKVTVPPLGKVGNVKVPKLVWLPIGGHPAPPVVEVQPMPVTVKLATAGSVTVVLFAALGPLFVTIIL